MWRGYGSRVLSGNGYVKAETREKVRRAIEALNYTPNEMARDLFYQRSGIVAVFAVTAAPALPWKPPARC